MSIASQPLAFPRSSFATVLRDYAELTKLRVTTLVVMTAWCGYYFGSLKSGVSSLSWNLIHALVGIGLVSGGTAALNEVIEHDIDGRDFESFAGQSPRSARCPLDGCLCGTPL